MQFDRLRVSAYRATASAEPFTGCKGSRVILRCLLLDEDLSARTTDCFVLPLDQLVGRRAPMPVSSAVRRPNPHRTCQTRPVAGGADVPWGFGCGTAGAM